MIYLTTDEVIRLHERVIAQSGGLPGIKNRGLIDSACAQPRATFGGQDLLPTLPEKAAALGFSLARNHGFEDGNKRIGHAAMETFLVLNGYEIDAPVEEQEALFLRVAGKTATKDELTAWVAEHIKPLSSADEEGG